MNLRHTHSCIVNFTQLKHKVKLNPSGSTEAVKQRKNFHPSRRRRTSLLDTREQEPITDQFLSFQFLTFIVNSSVCWLIGP